MSGEGSKPNPEINKPEPPVLEFKRLTAECGRGAFSCGERDVDDWFQQECLKDHGNFKMRTVIAREIKDQRVSGFYSLKLQTEKLSDLAGKSKISIFAPGGYVPVVRVCWVAVRSDSQRKGFGTVIMGAVLKDFHDIVLKTGLSFLTLSAINDKTTDFYAKLGFHRYGPSKTYPSMFLNAKAVVDLLGEGD